MNIKIEPVSEMDIAEYIKTFGNSDVANIFDDRVKLTATDDDGRSAYVFIEQNRVFMLGLDYIRSHAKVQKLGFLDEWYVTISEDDFYNDPVKNPPQTIHLQFCGIESGTGREVYRDITSKRYYLRYVSPSECFAKWYICGTLRRLDDGDPPRPNITFECNGQTELVRYRDWNGVAAYSDTFNPNFIDLVENLQMTAPNEEEE